MSGRITPILLILVSGIIWTAAGGFLLFSLVVIGAGLSADSEIGMSIFGVFIRLIPFLGIAYIIIGFLISKHLIKSHHTISYWHIFTFIIGFILIMILLGGAASSFSDPLKFLRW